MLVKPTHIEWGSMARRGISFCLSVSGDILNCISNEIVLYLKHDPTYKVIVYSNTKTSSEGHLLALAKKSMTSNSIAGAAIPLTGDSGLMMKNWLVALFSSSIQSDESNLQVLLARNGTCMPGTARSRGSRGPVPSLLQLQPILVTAIADQERAFNEGAHHSIQRTNDCCLLLASTLTVLPRLIGGLLRKPVYRYES
jgi:hypothetical protein